MDNYNFMKVLLAIHFVVIKKFSCDMNVTRNRNFSDYFITEKSSTWNIRNESSTVSVTKDTNVTETTQLPLLEAENATATEYEEPSIIYRKTGEPTRHTDKIPCACFSKQFPWALSLSGVLVPPPCEKSMIFLVASESDGVLSFLEYTQWCNFPVVQVTWCLLIILNFYTHDIFYHLALRRKFRST